MTLAVAFWILMLLWLVLGLYMGYQRRADGALAQGGNLMLFLLLLVLGWHSFGSPISG